MIGETTLAMLYVPLFFYIFDRLKERGEGKRAAGVDDHAGGDGGAAAARPSEAD